MSTTAQNPDAASTATEPDALLDWSAFTLKASGPATRLAVDEDGDWCEQTETTLHVKRSIEDYEDLLTYINQPRKGKPKLGWGETSENTNRSDDYQDRVVEELFEEASDEYRLGEHTAEDWEVTVTAPISTWADLYNAIDRLEREVKDSEDSRRCFLEMCQQYGVTGPNLSLVLAAAATCDGKAYKQSDHLIEYSKLTDLGETLTVAE
jgi:hypothetical protein